MVLGLWCELLGVSSPQADAEILSLAAQALQTLGFTGARIEVGLPSLVRDLLESTGRPLDHDGRWSAEGRVHEGLLERLLDEPFLRRSPPKSTGRDLFSLDWLDARLQAMSTGERPAARDVQATLAEYTARAACEALHRHAPRTDALLVCGGGAYNGDLMRRLARLRPQTEVRTTHQSHGVPVDQVEALAFAWLAHAHLQGRAGNVPAVTGARGARVLGCLHPAGCVGSRDG